MMKYLNFWRHSLFISAMLSSSIHAALPPDSQARVTIELLEKATQARLAAKVLIEVEVNNVSATFYKNNDCPQETVWHVDANVKSVARGSFSVGDVIQLNYSTHNYICPGPFNFEPSSLSRGQVVNAYLTCDALQCKLAAGAWSFTSEQDFLAQMTRAQDELEKYQDPRTVARNPLYQRLVYFDFRSDKLPKQIDAMLATHADYLVRHREKSILLRAHTDEGTRLEHEFGLGEKRGRMVMNALLKLGVDAKQIEVQSVGNLIPCIASGPLKLRRENRRVYIWYKDINSEEQFPSECSLAITGTSEKSGK